MVLIAETITTWLNMPVNMGQQWTQTPPPMPMNPKATPFQTRQNRAANEGNDGFKQLIDMMSLPKPSLITFNGDPMQYHVFMNSFKTCIGSAAVSDASTVDYVINRTL